MAEYTFEQLKNLTVADLREIASGVDHEAVRGYTQLNKEHLLPALCRALGIHHEHHVVGDFDKSAVKAKIRALKKERDVALEAHDHARLRAIRREVHRLNHQIRAHVR